MKKLTYEFDGDVNQLHDELLQALPELSENNETIEYIMQPTFEGDGEILHDDTAISPERTEDDKYVAMRTVVTRYVQTGEKIRETVKSSTPNLSVQSRDNELILIVPDDYDERKIENIIKAHKPKPPSEPAPVIDWQLQIASAKNVDDLKDVLSEFFARTGV